MDKPTPGPWTAKELGGSFDESRWVILHSDTSKGGVHMRRLDERGDFDAANAHLIAAAPDLLEALELILLTRETERNLQGKESPLHDRCRAAIAKAKGIVDVPT